VQTGRRVLWITIGNGPRAKRASGRAPASTVNLRLQRSGREPASSQRHFPSQRFPEIHCTSARMRRTKPWITQYHHVQHAPEYPQRIDLSMIKCVQVRVFGLTRRSRRGRCLRNHTGRSRCSVAERGDDRTDDTVVPIDRRNQWRALQKLEQTRHVRETFNALSWERSSCASVCCACRSSHSFSAAPQHRSQRVGPIRSVAGPAPAVRG